MNVLLVLRFEQVVFTLEGTKDMLYFYFNLLVKRIDTVQTRDGQFPDIGLIFDIGFIFGAVVCIACVTTQLCRCIAISQFDLLFH
jgi:hypothetical protein